MRRWFRPLAVAAAALVGCTQSATDLRRARADVTSSTSDLIRRCEERPTTVDKELAGKVIEASGWFGSVDPTGIIDNGVSKPGVFVGPSMLESVRFGPIPGGVSCFLHPDALEDGNGFGKNLHAPVTVKGKFYKYNGSILVLSPCVVVSRDALYGN